jgi:hypothetical protein
VKPSTVYQIAVAATEKPPALARLAINL